jgi:hypothetical protein
MLMRNGLRVRARRMCLGMLARGRSAVRKIRGRGPGRNLEDVANGVRTTRAGGQQQRGSIRQRVHRALEAQGAGARGALVLARGVSRVMIQGPRGAPSPKSVTGAVMSRITVGEALAQTRLRFAPCHASRIRVLRRAVRIPSVTTAACVRPRYARSVKRRDPNRTPQTSKLGTVTHISAPERCESHPAGARSVSRPRKVTDCRPTSWNVFETGKLADNVKATSPGRGPAWLVIWPWATTWPSRLMVRRRAGHRSWTWWRGWLRDGCDCGSPMEGTCATRRAAPASHDGSRATCRLYARKLGAMFGARPPRCASYPRCGRKDATESSCLGGPSAAPGGIARSS